MKVIITANGKGERMKEVSEAPKYNLLYKGKTILDNLLSVFPNAYILTHHDLEGYKVIPCLPTETRKETLSFVEVWTDVLIVDCDIIVDEFPFTPDEDTIYCKPTNHEDIGGGMSASGLYFVKSVSALLERMQGDSIASGMKEAKRVELNTKHLGTPKEYYDSIG